MAVIKKPRKHDAAFEEKFTSAYYLSQWRGRGVVLEIPPLRGVNTRVQSQGFVGPRSIQETFREIADQLCEKHPDMSIDRQVLDGTPHIKGTRLSVANILASLYHLGGVDAVADRFKQITGKHQVREALAYAHDFMEMTCDPSEDDD